MAGDDGKGKGKPMNILMVTSAFPPYVGGAAVQATYLAQGLKARGVDV